MTQSNFIRKCSSLMLMPLLIKLLNSIIVSFKNPRFDGLDVPTDNAIGKGIGGFKLHISPRTGHTDLLVLLKSESPSIVS